jgi:hypothetical protein
LKYFLLLILLFTSNCFAQEITKVDANSVEVVTQKEFRLKYTYEQLVARVKIAEANLVKAQKELADAQATFNQAKAQGVMAKTPAIKPQVELEK